LTAPAVTARRNPNFRSWLGVAACGEAWRTLQQNSLRRQSLQKRTTSSSRSGVKGTDRSRTESAVRARARVIPALACQQREDKVKTTYLPTLPKCDAADCTRSARYDAPTRMGSWANLCKHHYRSLAISGQGTRLDTTANKPQPAPTKQPSIAELTEMVYEGIAIATDGCSVEPDGCCEHGCESWLLHLGYI